MPSGRSGLVMTSCSCGASSVGINPDERSTYPRCGSSTQTKKQTERMITMGTSDAGDKIPGLDRAVPSGDVVRFADKAMFTAAPMAEIHPKVHLLWMTPDPLGA